MHHTNLILITNHFPFGKGEEFIDNEFPYLQSAFKNVFVLAKNVDAPKRPIANQVMTERYNPASGLVGSVLGIWVILKRWSTFRALVISEIQYLKSRKKTLPYRHVLHHTVKAFQLADKIEQLIDKHQVKGSLLLYSYWFTSSALAISLVRTNNQPLIKIARAHGGDLYEERSKNGYLPFRELIPSRINQVYTISNNGSNYLKSIIDIGLHPKINISRLGTPAHKGTAPTERSGEYWMVSCSNIIPLKRVHLIIESLGLIHEIKIRWIHFGDGPLRKEIEEKAKSVLEKKENVQFTFYGHVQNNELLRFYSENHIDLFINTSQYEGIPVTMMEAMSFGIPVIGTHVGAVNEIITNEAGILLDGNASPVVIAEAIQSYLKKEPVEKEKMLRAAFNQWNKNYNSEVNFSKFANSLKALIHEN